MMTEILERLEYTVHSTDKAKEALSTIEHGTVDLCLLDLNMPGVSGFELLKLVRRRHLPIPVIVVSAYISETVAKDLAAVGIQGMVAKPFKKDRITEEIQRVAKKFLGM
jgi:CheY-like chemotaxis protein